MNDTMDPRTIRAKEKYEGKVFFTKEGTRQFEILKFNSGADIHIHFLGTDLERHVSSYDLSKGIRDPFLHIINNRQYTTLFFEDTDKEILGNYYRTNEGYIIKAIAVDTKKRVTYQFQDQFGYIGCTSIQNIQKGEVKNPYHCNKFGGYMGEGPYTGTEFIWLRRMWSNMLMRCDNEYYAIHHKLKAINQVLTSMTPDWLNYSVFSHWYMTETAKLNPVYQKQYVMNKDLLYPYYKAQTGGQKYYSPTTVLLLPDDLNTSIINSNYIEIVNPVGAAHFRVPVDNIVKKADYYYSQGAMDQRTYDIIMRTFTTKQQ